jgi:putative hemolysin
VDVESTWAALLLIVVTLLVAFVAAAEIALAVTTRSRIRQLLESNVNRAKVLDLLLNDPARFLSTLMLLRNASYLVGGAAAIWWSSHQPWSLSQRVIFLGVVLFVMVVVQTVSRSATLRQPEQVALLCGPVVQFFVLLLMPFSLGLLWANRQIFGQAENVPAESIFLNEDGLRFLVNVGESESAIEEEEKQMIASIFELGDTLVREIMVPRLDVAAVEVETPLAEALDLIIAKGHSRIPVYEGSIDQVVGFLYAKDLLRSYRDQQTNLPLRQILRKAYFVPQSKKVDELFHDMQLRRIHAAVVVDEYGGTAGMVTIEDLLEEIVGEIQDEYDAEEPIYQQLGPTTYLFNGRIDLDEVSTLIGLDLTQENGNVDTLGGFIYNQLGRVPVQGESLEYQERFFTVISIESRRIEQVRVEWDPSLTQPDETQVRTNGVVPSVELRRDNDHPFLRYLT